jgi:hypothetical protein
MQTFGQKITARLAYHAPQNMALLAVCQLENSSSKCDRRV